MSDPKPPTGTTGNTPPPQTGGAQQNGDELERLKKLREALAPKAEPLEGKTTLDESVAIESATLAYHSLGLIADEIARILRAKNIRQVVILNSPDTASLLDLRWITARAEAIRQTFAAITPPPAMKEAAAAAIGAAVGTATVLVKSLVDLAAMFRSEVDMKTAEITLEDTALVSELARQLQPETKLFYPQILPFDLASSEAIRNSEILTQLQDLHEAELQAEQTVSEQNKELLASAKAALQALRDDLLKLDTTSETTLLSRLLRAELLENRLKEEGSYLLYLKIAKAGGDKRTVHSRIRSRDEVSYSGGAIVTYMLFAKDGSVASSQTLFLHSGFREFARGDEEEFPLSNF